MVQVRDTLDGLWSVGDVVLFTWMSFLQNDLIDALSITSLLSVTADAFAAIVDHENIIHKQVPLYKGRTYWQNILSVVGNISKKWKA